MKRSVLGRGIGVAVGTGVAVGGTGVAVGGTGVAVGGTGVAVGGTGVAVDGTGVAVGGTGVGSATGAALAATGSVEVEVVSSPPQAITPSKPNPNIPNTSTLLKFIKISLYRFQITYYSALRI